MYYLITSHLLFKTINYKMMPAYHHTKKTGNAGLRLFISQRAHHISAASRRYFLP